MKLVKNLLGQKGQTALEYALVIAVVAAVIIFAARGIFGNKDSGVGQQIFQKSINSVSESIDDMKSN